MAKFGTGDCSFGWIGLKAFLNPSPPLEREKFVKIVEFTIPKVGLLSIHKMRL